MENQPLISKFIHLLAYFTPRLVFIKIIAQWASRNLLWRRRARKCKMRGAPNAKIDAGWLTRLLCTFYAPALICIFLHSDRASERLLLVIKKESAFVSLTLSSIHKRRASIKQIIFITNLCAGTGRRICCHVTHLHSFVIAASGMQEKNWFPQGGDSDNRCAGYHIIYGLGTQLKFCSNELKRRIVIIN